MNPERSDGTGALEPAAVGGGALARAKEALHGAPRPSIPDGQTLRKDGIAGLINAVVSVPDGLAAAALAGVSPVYGLYAGITGRFAGAVLSSSQLMQVVTTSAAALAAGQAIKAGTGDRAEAMFLLVVLIGLFQVGFGFLRLGQLTKFVSHSVMTGFLIGVAVLLVLDQMAVFVGYAPEGSNEVSQLIDLMQNRESFHTGSIVIAMTALAILVGMNRTRFGVIGPLIALIVPTLAVAIADATGVELVKDVGDIPRGFPPFGIPSLDALSVELMGSAAAIAAIVVVQGAGVGQSFPNPDGRPASVSRDFIAQGAGNVASGLFSGIPVGGSVGQTALNVSTGAASRWSGIFASAAMLAIVLIVPGLVEIVPMAALAALMVMAGIGAINLPEAISIWRTGWASRVPIAVTFVATLFLSIPVAVAIGVGVSVVLYLASASDISLHELVELPGGAIVEREPPAALPSHAVTVLGMYGSLFFAGARVLQRRLPSAVDAREAVVVLRVRGHTNVGATLVDVLRRYSEQLAAGGGRLYISGVATEFHQRLQHAGKLDLSGPVQVIAAADAIGASTRRARDEADAWLVSHVADGA